jgi:hypothetical protein
MLKLGAANRTQAALSAVNLDGRSGGLTAVLFCELSDLAQTTVSVVTIGT